MNTNVSIFIHPQHHSYGGEPKNQNQNTVFQTYLSQFNSCKIDRILYYREVRFPRRSSEVLVMKLRALSLVSAMLKIDYAMQYTYSYTLLIHIPILKPICDDNSEHCLWLLLCSKSSMLCSIPIAILYLYM